MHKQNAIIYYRQKQATGGSNWTQLSCAAGQPSPSPNFPAGFYLLQIHVTKICIVVLEYRRKGIKGTHEKSYYSAWFLVSGNQWWQFQIKVLCSSKMRIYSTGKSKQNAQAKCDYILQAKASNRRVELNPTVMRRRPTITITQFSCWFLPSTDPRHQNLYCGSRISKEGNQRNTREIILFCLVLGQR